MERLTINAKEEHHNIHRHLASFEAISKASVRETTETAWICVWLYKFCNPFLLF